MFFQCANQQLAELWLGETWRTFAWCNGTCWCQIQHWSVCDVHGTASWMSVVLRQTLLAALVQGRSSLCVDTIIAGDGKDMNEEFEETMKVSFQNSSSTYFTLKLKLMLCGFIKSSINFTETWCTAVDKGNYIDENMLGFCGRMSWINVVETLWTILGAWLRGGGELIGAHLNQVWPIRF